MNESTLEILKPLLGYLRGFEVLEETRDHKFLLKGRDFIHFHDDPDGLWADAKLTRQRVRVSVASAVEQGELMELISPKLDALESSGRKRQDRRQTMGA